MRLLNFEPLNMQPFFTTATDCKVELPISIDGEHQVIDWVDFKERIIITQQKYITQKSTIAIESFPPFETHPYIKNDRKLNNNKTIVLGTFPPPSYLHVLYPAYSNREFFKGINIDKSPPLYFFYGNRGSLWDILDKDLEQEIIEQFLDKSNIFLSDIILYAQRKSLTKGRASDSNYVNIIPNIPLIKQLIEGPNTIENIVFTSKQWDVTDGGGKGKRTKNYVPKSIQFTEENSAVSLFFRTLISQGVKFGFQKLNSEEILQFEPANYFRIKREFTELFAFNLIINKKVFQLNLADSPSGNAFTPFDSITFLKWIKIKFGDKGLNVLRNHPRNSKTEKIKRERKAPIQRDLNYPEGKDICDDFQREMYTMFLNRNFPLIKEIQNQEL